MPLKMFCDSDQGPSPTIFCDQCGTRIETAADGDCRWRDIAEGDGATNLYFTHKRCGVTLLHARGGDEGWSSLGLTQLPTRLTEALKVGPLPRRLQ
jgi:hypothetical protein